MNLSPPGLENICPNQTIQQKDIDMLTVPQKASGQSLPIPKGYSPYCMAKRAEYLEKDLKKAQSYYELSIKTKDRFPSAVKDLAGVLHQQGKTAEAVEILEKYKFVFKNNKQKLGNLLDQLKKQIQPTGNAANKHIKISNFTMTKVELLDMFQNSDRIISVDVNYEQQTAIIKFNSHSSARKSMDCFKG